MITEQIKPTSRHQTKEIDGVMAKCRENPDIQALFLIGGANAGDRHSGIEVAAIVTRSFYEQKMKEGNADEVVFDICTYEGGLFNIFYMTPEDLEVIALWGTEPMRNLFLDAQALYCDEPDYIHVVSQIPLFPTDDAAEKQNRYYCTMKKFHLYYWQKLKPNGYMKLHIANGIIYHLYRLILLENEVLYPSARKLEDFVSLAASKPSGIIEKCHALIAKIFEATDADIAELIDTYEKWTNFDYPKDRQTIMRNFINPFEWE